MPSAPNRTSRCSTQAQKWQNIFLSDYYVANHKSDLEKVIHAKECVACSIEMEIIIGIYSYKTYM